MIFKKPNGHDYHRFSGWRLIALLAVFLLYTLWFTGPGPFGELDRLEGYSLLQARGFYTGADALAAVESLTDEGRRIKYTALGFDVIYMFLQTWVFEAVIAFGLSALGLLKSRWRWLLLVPMGFLLFDILEDSSLAILLATPSELIGSLAGVFTLMKFVFFLPLVLLSLGLGVAGSVVTILQKRKTEDTPG